MKRGVAVAFVLALGFCLTVALSGAAYAQAPIQVTVSIVPQKYFVEQIGGKLVEVEVMVPPGSTPERYEPKPKQMVALSRSKIYFACGVPFESAWLPKIADANRSMLVAQTGEGIGKRRMEAHSHEEEVASKGPGGSGPAHRHEEEEELADPHIWLSPPLVMLQARHILTALVSVDPANRDAYEQNYRRFQSELVGLDLAIFRLFRERREGRDFMVFHPAWGYFADAYGLKQIPVEIEGKEPRAKDLERFIKLGKELKIKTIFIQPQYSDKSARVIADAIGAQLVQADDLAADWAANLIEVARQISGAAQPPGQ